MLTVNNPAGTDYKTDPQPGLMLRAKGMSVQVLARAELIDRTEVVLLMEGDRRTWRTLAEWREWWTPTKEEIVVEGEDDGG